MVFPNLGRRQVGNVHRSVSLGAAPIGSLVASRFEKQPALAWLFEAPERQNLDIIILQFSPRFDWKRATGIERC